MSSARDRLDLRLLLPALVGWACAVGVLIGQDVGALAALLVLLVASVRSARRRSPWATSTVLALVSSLVLAGAAAAHRSAESAGLLPELAARGSLVDLEGTLALDPVPLAERHGERTYRTVLRIESVQHRGISGGSSATITLFADASVADLQWRDRVRLRARVQPSTLDPDSITARAIGPVHLVSDAGLFVGAATHVRSSLREAASVLPDDPAGLLPSLVVGDTSAMPPDLKDDMVVTGMSHLSAVSGSNVTILCVALQWLCGWMRVPRRWRTPVAVLGLIGFAAVCRPEPSVIRAAVMGTVGLLALGSTGRRGAAPALGAAILLLLVIDPSLATTFGFALSVLATLGLVLWARPWADAMNRHLPVWAHPLGDATSVPLAAQVMTAPVVILLQPEVPVIGVPANMAAAPFVAPATIVGFAVAVVAAVGLPFAGALAWVAGLPAWAICAVARVCADVPNGRVPWLSGVGGAVALAGLLLLLLVVGPGVWQRLEHKAVAGTGCALLAAAALSPVPTPAVRGAWFAAICDVGQGDAFVVRTGERSALLVDTGPAPEPLEECLRRLGVEVLDALVLTHFHADHVGGVRAAISRPTGSVLVTSVTDPATGTGGTGGEESLEEPTLELLQKEGLPVHRVRTGQVWQWRDVKANVLWPARVIHSGAVGNNGSIVLDLRARGERIVITGDIEKEAASAVRRSLHEDPGPPVSVYKVPHHGSGNQDPRLVQVLRPQVAAIGVGENDFGHPSKVALDTLRGAHVVRTDQDGTVLFRRDGGALVASALR